jgi:Spy/CpxP family protein refolding chaperone
MRRVLLALVAGGFITAFALAQFGPRGGGGGAGMLLGNSGVQKELKLTDDQTAKVKDYLEKSRAKMQEAFQAGDREKAQEVMKEVAQETDKFIKDTLKEDQVKRLKQIQRQVAGPNAFSDEEVAKALKLTDEQKEDIKKINEELGTARREAFQGGGFNDPDKRAETQKKLTNLNKEAMDKITKMLTPDQKKEWKEVTGEPFEFRPEFGPGGGFGKGGKGGKGKREEKK